MALDPRQLLKPVRTLKKAVKKLPKTPSPEQVHTLRTQSRRLEAVLQALRFDRTKRGRRLLESLTPIRKRAGKVRDMDVLTALAAGLPRGDREAGQMDDSVVALRELLGSRRLRLAKRLYKTVSGASRELRGELKRFRADVRKRMTNSRRPRSGADRARSDPAAVAASLAEELAAWPRIDRNTLHPLRLEVKKLCYILQLAKEPDARLIQALGEVKDRIGEWHDWHGLEEAARKMPASDANLVQRIHSISEAELERAAEAARNLLERHLAAARDHRGLRKPARAKEPVPISAARLSA